MAETDHGKSANAHHGIPKDFISPYSFFWETRLKPDKKYLERSWNTQKLLKADLKTRLNQICLKTILENGRMFSEIWILLNNKSKV